MANQLPNERIGTQSTTVGRRCYVLQGKCLGRKTGNVHLLGAKALCMYRVVGMSIVQELCERLWAIATGTGECDEKTRTKTQHYYREQLIVEAIVVNPLAVYSSHGNVPTDGLSAQESRTACSCITLRCRTPFPSLRPGLAWPGPTLTFVNFSLDRCCIVQCLETGGNIVGKSSAHAYTTRSPFPIVLRPAMP